MPVYGLSLICSKTLIGPIIVKRSPQMVGPVMHSF